ncbi:MAG TPA: ChbG/HpnK family deacetylase, partial [Candidatus Limnocylindria bacterium]|nr:ChbG/HpnK family deacetylase [Candidatus Limnocylindria bacterium]
GPHRRARGLGWGRVTRRLIVNADDLGRSRGVNRGVLLAHRHGIVTSTTLMANAEAAEDAAALARDQKRLGVGVHLVLTYGKPLSPPRAVPSLVRDDGSFPPRPHLVRGRLRGEEVLAEFRRQIDRVVKLIGRAPTHLDTHHFVQDEPEVLWAFTAVAKERALPVRSQSLAQRDSFRRNGLRTPDHFVRDFYGTEAVTAAALLGIFDRIGNGTSELMCHPAEVDEALLTSSYARERPAELATLTSPEVIVAARDRFDLITFAQL